MAKKSSIPSRGTKSSATPSKPKAKAKAPTIRRSNVTSPLALTFKDLEPNWRAYIAYVDYAANDGNEDMKRIIDSFKGLTKREKELVMPERLCDLAGVRPSELVAAVCGQVWAHQSGESAMAAAILHPKIVRKTAKAAENIKWGGKDRELFFRISGSLPDKKGTTIINNNNPQILNASASALSATHLGSMSERTLEMEKLLAEPQTINVLPENSPANAR